MIAKVGDKIRFKRYDLHTGKVAGDIVVITEVLDKTEDLSSPGEGYSTKVNAEGVEVEFWTVNSYCELVPEETFTEEELSRAQKIKPHEDLAKFLDL